MGQKQDWYAAAKQWVRYGFSYDSGPAGEGLLLRHRFVENASAHSRMRGTTLGMSHALRRVDARLVTASLLFTIALAVPTSTQAAATQAAECDCKAQRAQVVHDTQFLADRTAAAEKRRATEVIEEARLDPALKAYEIAWAANIAAFFALAKCLGESAKAPVLIVACVALDILAREALDRELAASNYLEVVAGAVEAAHLLRVQAEAAVQKALKALRKSRAALLACETRVQANVDRGLCPYATKPYAAMPHGMAGHGQAWWPNHADSAVSAVDLRGAPAPTAAQTRPRRRETAIVRLKTTLLLPDGGSGDMSVVAGRGVYDFVRARGYLRLRFNEARASLRANVAQATLYRYLPRPRPGKPLRRPWLAAPRGLVGIDPLMILTFRPHRALVQVRRILPAPRRVGKVRIRGVRTTHYRGRARAKDILAVAPHDARSVVVRAFLDLGAAGPLVDVWIDRAGRLRRIALRLRANCPRRTRVCTTVSAVGELYRFGQPVRYARPPRGQTRLVVGAS